MKWFRFHAERAGWSAAEMARATTDIGAPFPIVDFVAEAEQCLVCGSALRIRKSQCRQEAVISADAGPFIPREVIKECTQDVTHPVARSARLAHIVRPRQRFADLCRHPHKSAYAETRIMPSKPWRATEIGWNCSA